MKKEEKETKGYVYLIEDINNNTFKIGVTKEQDPNNRLKKLQTGNSTQLVIRELIETDYPFRLETMLHNKYQNYNVLNEWYKLPDISVKTFSTACKDLIEVINILQKSNEFFAKELK